jgi:hypothetical protein
MTENLNPLQKYYRQPAISIKLPSGEKYYKSDVVAKTTTGEHPVLPMTAMDELAFRTPDAMMNGQATVDVIKSCIPTILDPWRLVNYDIDTVLVGIRIASFGETMEVTSVAPVTNDSIKHEIRLPDVLDRIQQQKINDTFTTSDGLVIEIKPLTYKEMTDAQLKTFEQQRLYTQINASELPAEEKTKRFTESFKKLNELNSTLLINNINSIKLPDGQSVSDPIQIKSFVENAGAKKIKEIENALIEMRSQGAVKPFTVKSDEEQIKKGAPISYEVPLTFDNSNFFV